MRVYLVENCGNTPGRIMAVFAHEEDANLFALAVEDEFDEIHQVVPRTLFYGQPSVQGYNE